LVQDLIDVGGHKLLSLSLVTFNKKLAYMMAGNLDDMAGLTERLELLDVCEAYSWCLADQFDFRL
jgi:hypothetical protein